MTDAKQCGSCGALVEPGAKFCYSCGLQLTSDVPSLAAGGQIEPSGPPSAPPPYPGAGTTANAPAGPYAYQPLRTAAVRPFGMVLLPIVEIVIAVVGLTAVVDLLYWGVYSSYYHEAESSLDLTMGLAYLATSIAGFAIARGLWSMRSSAWKPACVLSVVLLAFDLVSILEWGVTGLDIVGIVAHLSVLAYLNTNPIRALFGQPPTEFLQGPSRS